MRQRFLLTLCSLVLAAVVLSRDARALDFFEAPAGDDLRLRLDDPVQEARTTSLNWIDLRLPPLSPTLDEETTASAPAQPLRIVIDPGHGGRDLGAHGLYAILEKNLCLHLGRLIKGQIELQATLLGVPVEVRLTRDKDRFLPLKERARVANEWGADLFVSIHGNSAETKLAHGFEVYFLSASATDRAAHKLAKLENEYESAEHAPIPGDVLSILSDVRATQHVSESSRFAETVFDALSRGFHPNGRGVRQAPFSVLSGTEMPALLVEVGYLTNQAEALKLITPSYLKRLAGAISTGILEFAVPVEKSSTKKVTKRNSNSRAS